MEENASRGTGIPPFWKGPFMPVEVNMIEFCPYIRTNSFSIGPDNSSFSFLLLDAQSPPRILQRCLLRKCRLEKCPLQSLKESFPTPAKIKSEIFSLAASWKHIYENNRIYLCSFLFTWLVPGGIQGLAISVENSLIYTCKTRIKTPRAAQHR